MRPDFNFHTHLKVRFNETDMQGHVNFGHYLFYFDVGAVEYLDAIGMNYHRLLEEGVDLLYVESHCNYKSPAKWPEVLDVHTRIANLGNRSMRFEFAVHSQTDQRLIATGHIVTVIANRETFEPCPIPESLRAAVLKFEPDLPQEK